jgi:hypothetical protein
MLSVKASCDFLKDTGCLPEDRLGMARGSAEYERKRKRRELAPRGVKELQLVCSR